MHVGNVLDPDYVPGPGEIVMFNAHNDFVYEIFERTVVTPMGNASSDHTLLTETSRLFTKHSASKLRTATCQIRRNVTSLLKFVVVINKELHKL